MLEKIIVLIGETLLIDTTGFNTKTPLLGAMPELDSIGVIMILTALEEQFGLSITDDEVDATIFENIESLLQFVTQH